MTIILIFKLPQYNIKFLFLLIEKIIIIICFLLLQLTYKDSILYYNSIKVIINISNFTKVIFNIIVYYYCFLCLVITDNNFFCNFNLYHNYIMFYILNKTFLLYFICILVALLKSQIIFSKAYF